ncbi:DUF1330 domain-containing protein [Chryseobacterium phosphatilyticum]|uniref:DUF1330 domain-containing protein n=1 Tax=Chryseobacterium phosphatilyticum TaxID=475075 RepID=A0A316WUW9_9FLAO|nr:DUF1330 domain-containing protein [Chryseobacterium phosphatilyticum]PWN65015.1 DUF1330 domain-containing protein [Chryseobacterium phosphatilyticum]
MSKKYLTPTFEAGKHLFLKNIQGSVINLNLIKLKQEADYSEYPHLKPTEKISGWDAYFKYIKEAEPFLRASGGEIILIGKGDQFLIGPQDEQWDICMLIRQKTVADFFNFEQDENYMKITGHRIAAIEDSRLLPLEEVLMNTKEI